MESLRVLVVGSGAREHCLARHLSRSPLVTRVLCTPANAGIARDVEARSVAANDLDALVALCRSEAVNLVVVGPEAPLVAGLADRLAEVGVACVGPCAAAAQLEGSKAFAKDFMKRHDIPTAVYGRFNDPDLAGRFAREAPFRCVVKADGLAAGKGVVVCDTPDEALAAIDRFARARSLGDAGATLVIEERIEGAEVSFHVLCDGERYVVLGAAQDHKRLLDGDQGPNTGGMGAYSPVARWSDALEARVCREVVEPTLRGIAKDAASFRGVLFVGLMITPAGDPIVLEYNVRFGDPECAVLLACLDDDLTPWLLGAARGALPQGAPRRSERSALAVVIAAEGYPDAPRRGVEIRGIDTLEYRGAILYHAGTARDGARWVTAGGRVVLVTATARSAREAATIAYGAVDAISLPGAQVRRDIGHRAWSHS